MQYIRLLLFYSVIFQSVIFQSCKFQSCKFSYPDATTSPSPTHQIDGGVSGTNLPVNLCSRCSILQLATHPLVTLPAGKLG